MKTLYLSLGVLSVAMGIIGVFVPGMPTTVFVIAASYLFARSSPRLERWLEDNRWLGPPLQRFRQTRGMPRQSKVLALASMWTGLGLSIYALAGVGVGAQMLAVTLGVIGTAVILFGVRTTERRPRLILSSHPERFAALRWLLPYDSIPHANDAAAQHLRERASGPLTTHR
jgi:uncharacterized membrane protein YbaN (DUF454 family)